ncbi:MAG: WD40 repeat domain-containing protein [Pirellulaceae bacterium]
MSDTPSDKDKPNADAKAQQSVDAKGVDAKDVETKDADAKVADASKAAAPQADPTKTHVAQTIKHPTPLIACRFEPGGKYVFAAAQDYRVWRYELGTKEDPQPTEFAGHESWVRAIAFTADGKTMITGGYDGRLVWSPVDAKKPEPVRTVEAHDGWIRAIAVSPDGKLLASVGNDLLVKLWNAADGAAVGQLAGHESHIYNVAFHPEGGHLVSGDLKGNFLHWDLKAMKEQRRFAEETLHKYDGTFWADIGGPRGMAFSPDGGLLAASGITEVTNAFAGVGVPTVVVFDWRKGERKVQYLGKDKPRGTGWGVVMHPAGFTIGVSGGSGGFLLFWKGDEKDEFHQVKLPDTGRDLDLHPDGLRLATVHSNGQLVISKMADKA